MCVCVCVCVCVYGCVFLCVCFQLLGWIAPKQLPLLSFSMFVWMFGCVYLLRDTYKHMLLMQLCSFLCIILHPGQSPSGCVWFQSVPVISAGPRATCASSPLIPLCWILFCSVALHLILFCLLSSFLNSYLYHYYYRDESAGCEYVQQSKRE